MYYIYGKDLSGFVDPEIINAAIFSLTDILEIILLRVIAALYVSRFFFRRKLTSNFYGYGVFLRKKERLRVYA
jgi:hypothetical protein